jgi:glycosyltransferase involved in cell wall biosynthesis
MQPIASIIIPARNEEALIGQVLDAALRSVADWRGWPGPLPYLAGSGAEIMVVDNASTDGTARVVEAYADRHGVRLLNCAGLRAPVARNHGAAHAHGRILLFVDADTLLPPTAIGHIVSLIDQHGYEAGVTRLASLEGGLKARLWWEYWGLMRHLPLARAKAMPACMFCTRAVFQEFGPFDETVRIGEEWPILGGLYRTRPQRFIYDRTITARSSNRRMALQPFGYVRTFWRYVWAVLHASGRDTYSDHIRSGRHSSAEGG